MAKLTLSVDERVIRKAKRYASEAGSSVSELVERYLDRVTESESPGGEAPVLHRLQGVLRGGGDERGYRRHLDQKHR